MNRLWVALLFCSTSLSAVQKTHLDLEWRAPPYNEKSDFKMKWQEEKKVEKPGSTLTLQEKTTTWQKNPTNEMTGTAPYSLRQNRYTRPNLFSRVHRSNRQRVIDPTFSSSTSDGGYVPEVVSDYQSEFHSDSGPSSYSFSLKW